MIFSSTTCAFSILITIPYFLRVKKLRERFFDSIMRESQEEQLLRLASLDTRGVRCWPKLLPPDQVRTCVGMCLKTERNRELL